MLKVAQLVGPAPNYVGPVSSTELETGALSSSNEDIAAAIQTSRQEKKFFLTVSL